MTKPTDLYIPATDANFPAGSDDWSGQPTKVVPSAGEMAQGFTPGVTVPMEWLNLFLHNHGKWIEYLEGFTDDLPILETGIYAPGGSGLINVDTFSRDLAAWARLGPLIFVAGGGNLKTTAAGMARGTIVLPILPGFVHSAGAGVFTRASTTAEAEVTALRRTSNTAALWRIEDSQSSTNLNFSWNYLGVLEAV